MMVGADGSVTSCIDVADVVHHNFTLESLSSRQGLRFDGAELGTRTHTHTHTRRGHDT